jgi:thiamine pyrophosphokinase
MDRIALFGGGIINNYDSLKYYSYDFYIAVDKGLLHLDRLNIVPNLIVGDMDSVPTNLLRKYQNVKTILLDEKKDFTDSQYAFELTFDMKPKGVSLFAFTGERLDHTLTNIFMLKNFKQKNIKCNIIDDNNEIFLCDDEEKILKDKYKYISLLPLDDNIVVTLSGFKYPLNEKLLNRFDSLSISNEIIEEFGIIKKTRGNLLVIKSNDEKKSTT